MNWTWEFDETGGYDCMSSAYNIRDENGRVLVSVDVSDYVDSSGWEENHARNEEAERVAMLMAAVPQMVDMLKMAREVIRRSDRSALAAMPIDQLLLALGEDMVY